MNPSPESVLARLRNQARARGLPPQTMLLLYAQEGFLARLAASPYAERFVLKGGLSMYGRYGAEARPTRDIDLAGRGMPNTVEAVRGAISEIARLDLADGLSFDGEGLEVEEIIEDAVYTGIRVGLAVTLGKSRERLQLDVSFGNAITPAPVELAFPSLLGGEPHRVLGYPLETVVAEKLAAAVELGPTNTRMKDFYDVFWILGHEPPSTGSLRRAMGRTFAARGTDLARLLPTLEALDNPDTQRRWAQFLRNNPVEAPAEVGEVLRRIAERVREVLAAPG